MMQPRSKPRLSLQQMKRQHYALLFTSFMASLVRIAGLTLLIAALGFWVWFRTIIPFDATETGAFMNATLNGVCVAVTGELMSWSSKRMRAQLERRASAS